MAPLKRLTSSETKRSPTGAKCPNPNLLRALESSRVTSVAKDLACSAAVAQQSTRDFSGLKPLGMTPKFFLLLDVAQAAEALLDFLFRGGAALSAQDRGGFLLQGVNDEFIHRSIARHLGALLQLLQQVIINLQLVTEHNHALLQRPK